MRLLTNKRYRDSMLEALRGARSSLYLASAYMTLAGIEPILATLTQMTGTTKVLARWDARDLVFGASDLEVYEAVSARGFEFYINPKLHGKFSLINDLDLFLGSANFTASGLQLGVHGNWECGCVFESSELDRRLVRGLFNNSALVTPQLFADIKAFVLPLREKAKPEGLVFPAFIAEQLLDLVEGLWVRELFWTNDPASLRLDEVNDQHDVALLGIDPCQLSMLAQLGHSFRSTRCCKWLVSQLEQHGGQLYFGEAAELLHNALLEDPKPYRKDVKTLVNNLFSWSATALPSIFIVDIPSHSRRIRLRDAHRE
jgi:hypothetical protein